jgi:hypothetical protein
MPKTPTGAKRPADVIGNAVHVMRIATGQIEEPKPTATIESSRKGGLKGGKARAERLTPKERKEIAKKASAARWGRPNPAVVAPAKKERQGH